MKIIQPVNLLGFMKKVMLLSKKASEDKQKRPFKKDLARLENLVQQYVLLKIYSKFGNNVALPLKKKNMKIVLPRQVYYFYLFCKFRKVALNNFKLVEITLAKMKQYGRMERRLSKLLSIFFIAIFSKVYGDSVNYPLKKTLSRLRLAFETYFVD